MPNPKTKRVKAWVMMDWRGNGKIAFVFFSKKDAIKERRLLGDMVVPCTITYQLPAPKRIKR